MLRVVSSVVVHDQWIGDKRGYFQLGCGFIVRQRVHELRHLPSYIQIVFYSIGNDSGRILCNFCKAKYDDIYCVLLSLFTCETLPLQLC